MFVKTLTSNESLVKALEGGNLSVCMALDICKRPPLDAPAASASRVAGAALSPIGPHGRVTTAFLDSICQFVAKYATKKTTLSLAGINIDSQQLHDFACALQRQCAGKSGVTVIINDVDPTVVHADMPPLSLTVIDKPYAMTIHGVGDEEEVIGLGYGICVNLHLNRPVLVCCPWFACCAAPPASRPFTKDVATVSGYGATG